MKNALMQLFFLCLGGLLLASVYAFNSPAPKYDYMQFTAVESILPGGIGRSRILIDNGAGGTKEIKIKNLYAIVGIKMDNIHENDKSVANVLSNLSSEGWELVETSTGVQTPNNEGSTGIFCTRYILKRER